MQALFVCIGELGHVHPLLPLAHALADAGHPAYRLAAQRLSREITEMPTPDEVLSELEATVGR